MKKNDGGPAFPCDNGYWEDGLWHPAPHPGMSRRDYIILHAPALPAGVEDFVWELALKQVGGAYDLIGACKVYMAIVADIEQAYADATMALEAAERKK